MEGRQPSAFHRGRWATDRWRPLTSGFLIAMAVTAILAGCRRPAGGDGAVARGAAGGNIQFVDVTAPAGIRFRHFTGAFGRKYMPETTGSGCAFFDADGDGWLDLLALNGADWPGRRTGSHRPSLYRNRRDGGFQEVTTGAGLPKDIYGMGIAVGDYDNDGDEDLYLTCLGPNYLLRNNGDGTFADVTAKSGAAGAPIAPGGPRWKWSSSAAWVDYDRDGRLDLFVCNYVRWSPATDVVCRNRLGQKAYCAPTAYSGAPCTLYRNLGGGRFADVSAATGIRAHVGKSLGVAVADMNEDGWPDLLVANDMTPNFLFLNQRGRRFEEVGAEWGIGVGESGRAKAGMGIDAADWQNRGQPGLLVGNFSGEALSLFAPEEGAGLVDVTYPQGMGEPSLRSLTFGLFFFDFDLDGWKDAFIGNGHIDDTVEVEGSQVSYRQRSLIFRNEGGRGFREVGLASGPAPAAPMVVRGCAWGDYDRDGDPDVAVLWNGHGLRLWRNDGGDSRHWLGFRPVGRRSNHSGLGARIRVTAGGQTVTEVARSGSSYLSASQQWPIVGLGPEAQADRVVVEWPSGHTDQFTAVAGDRYYTLREGEPLAEF
jgi:enediyne biosynthesis protein E4